MDPDAGNLHMNGKSPLEGRPQLLISDLSGSGM